MSAYITARHREWRIKLNNPHAPSDIFAHGLVMPSNGAFTDARQMWLAADRAERRRDGEYRMRGGHPPSVATHADMSLPWGISRRKAKYLVDQISTHISRTHGVGVEWSIHTKNRGIDHVHFLWTSRKISGTTFGDKARSLNKIAMTQDPEVAKINPMEDIRAFASKTIFEVTKVHWDHRSFKRRGIKRAPEPKIDRREYRRQRRELEKSKDRSQSRTRIERLLWERRVRMANRRELEAELRAGKVARFENWRRHQQSERIRAATPPQPTTYEPLAQRPLSSPQPILAPQRPALAVGQQETQTKRRMAELEQTIRESNAEKQRRAEMVLTKTTPAPIQMPGVAAEPITSVPAPGELLESTPTPAQTRVAEASTLKLAGQSQEAEAASHEKVAEQAKSIAPQPVPASKPEPAPAPVSAPEHTSDLENSTPAKSQATAKPAAPPPPAAPEAPAPDLSSVRSTSIAAPPLTALTAPRTGSKTEPEPVKVAPTQTLMSSSEPVEPNDSWVGEPRTFLHDTKPAITAPAATQLRPDIVVPEESDVFYPTPASTGQEEPVADPAPAKPQIIVGVPPLPVATTFVEPIKIGHIGSRKKQKKRDMKRNEGPEP